jgi:catechol 2,3-dioxygenase-like lactoylglutathione lyase family enzyme
MRKNKNWIIACIACFLTGVALQSITAMQKSANIENRNIQNNNEELPIKLGAFSVSLSVKSVEISYAFYQKLGFEIHGGSLAKKYLILKNENAIIGIFEGMFKGNMLTFNPGWNQEASEIYPFDDIRDLQTHLDTNGILIENKIDTSTYGPASIVITDPDGNVILLDQHR